jgi:hypothetical protein
VKDKIVIFASYDQGPEFEKKLEKVNYLKETGINVDLFHLLRLTNSFGLPDAYVDRLIVNNIKAAIQLFEPNVLAFHNGITINLKKKEFVNAIGIIKDLNPGMTYLMECLNCPEKSSNFRDDPVFLGWCELNFEKDHILYDVIWKSKI